MEGNILKNIQLALSSLRLSVTFRNNTGLGWIGEVVNKTPTQLTIRNYRPIHAGLTKGSSDLIGWSTVEVTADMVGKKLAIFTAIEGKTASGRIKKEQLNFIKQVQQSGGIAGIARTASDAINLINMPNVL